MMGLTLSKETSFTLQALVDVKPCVLSMYHKLARLLRIPLVSTGHGSAQFSWATLTLMNQ